MSEQKTKRLQLLGNFNDGLDLPEVSEADNGKILGVVNGGWGAIDPPSTIQDVFDGPYEVTPTVETQTLETAQKVMDSDLTIKAIPCYRVSNTAGGSTVYIGSEV
jgi:hypothetical protein